MAFSEANGWAGSSGKQSLLAFSRARYQRYKWCAAQPPTTFALSDS